MKSVLTIVASLVISTCAYSAGNLADLSQSTLWQVRYGVASELGTVSDTSKTILETLSNDKDVRVARNAFSYYSRTFLDLKKELIKVAFDRGDFNLVGFLVTDQNIFKTGDFWLSELHRENSGRAIHNLGLLKFKEALPELSKFRDNDNPYILTELAMSFYRLDKLGLYLETINKVMSLPVKDNLHYQTVSINYLIQTHPELAKSLWNKIGAKISKHPDLQPNWVYAHAKQYYAMPK